MHGLAKEKDLSFLLERELLQVCVGVYQVILKFEGGIEISLECDYQVVPDLSSSPAASLLNLLGSRITNVEKSGNGGVVLGFSDRGTIRIHDSNKDYESYQIVTPEQQIIV